MRAGSDYLVARTDGAAFEGQRRSRIMADSAD
jgi:hypothetical protein